MGVRTDIGRGRGREPLDEAGLRPIAAVAVDEVGSALRFRAKDLVGS